MGRLMKKHREEGFMFESEIETEIIRINLMSRVGLKRQPNIK